MMATTTDFFSTGSFLVFDDFGAVAHEVVVGVSPVPSHLTRNASAIQEKEIGTLRLYPNPASGSIVVSGNGMLRIYNTTGQLVDEQTIVSGQADVSALIDWSVHPATGTGWCDIYLHTGEGIIHATAALDLWRMVADRTLVLQAAICCN